MIAHIHPCVEPACLGIAQHPRRAAKRVNALMLRRVTETAQMVLRISQLKRSVASAISRPPKAFSPVDQGELTLRITPAGDGARRRRGLDRLQVPAS
jgi:hypothetical protein